LCPTEHQAIEGHFGTKKEAAHLQAASLAQSLDIGGISGVPIPETPFIKNAIIFHHLSRYH
jgi:hypothetical protein